MQRAEKTSQPSGDKVQRQARVEPAVAPAGVDESSHMVAQRQQIRRLFGAAAQLHGSAGELSVQREAAAVVPPKRSGLPAGLEAGAVQRKVGFEFQMLNTSVGLMDEADVPVMVEETGKPNKNSFSSYPHTLLGLNNAPKFVVDGMKWKKGANAEYATQVQYDDPAQAENDVQEMATHAKTNIVKNKATDLGGKHLFVWRCDSANGQPQVNVDVAFENVGKEEKLRYPGTAKKPVTSKDTYIGVTKPLWNIKDTDAFLKRRIEAKTFLDTMDLPGLEFFIIEPQSEAEVESTEAPMLAGLPTLVSAMKVAVMTYVSGKLPAGATELRKDLPILPKIKLPKLFQSVELKLATLNKRALKLDQMGLLAHVVKLGDAVLDKVLSPQEVQADNLENMGGENQHLPKKIGGAGTVKPDMDKETVVMEYRRAKVLPVGEWPGFARDAVTVFNGFDRPTAT